MSADAVNVGHLRVLVERIERVEADIKELNADKSDIYKEVRGYGYDVKAVRAVVAKRKLDSAEREERDAIFNLYWDALNGSSRVHVHEAGTFDPETGEVIQDQSVMDIGLAEPALMQGSSLPANIKSATNTRDPHFLEADDGQPRTTSTDACGANCDGLPPVAGHGGEQPKHYAKSEQSVTHSNTTLATSPEASRKAGEGVLLPLSPAANPDEGVPDFLKRGAA